MADETTNTDEHIRDLEGQLRAIDRVMAVIEFELDGTILRANENFLQTVGYSASEVVGKHHRIFMPPGEGNSEAYAAFWAGLRRGEYSAGQFKRVGASGDEVWIQASYNPVFDAEGNPYKVVKYATNITEQVQKTADQEGQIAAVSRSMAVIEFDLDGTIRTANENFLTTTGYTLSEIVGQHHRIFCDPEYTQSRAYAQLWEDLGRGEFSAGEFKRFGKSGDEVWIQASYNPIFDAEGNPYKVVKYATNITEQVQKTADQEGQIAAVSRSMAVIEFDLDGTIRTANENFLSTTGYALSEIVGRHHRIFCDPEYAESRAYAQLWEDLGRGEFSAGEFKRFGKSGDEVWIQASYNPIFDADGRPFKVVKYASDVSEQVRARKRVEAVAADVLDASQALSTVADELSESSDEAVSAAGAALDAGRDVDQSIQSVAAATEQMVMTVSEISRNASQAAEVASNAVTVTDAASDAIGRLDASGKQISEVVKLISSIAQQTNLLALNATIEAARAGEAGRGFAVVANEVKELSKETASATQEIGQKIDAIQSDTERTVGAISEITKIVADVADIANSIAAAVEEQSVTTSDISQTLTEAATGSSAIADLIGGLNEGAQSSKASADSTLESARSLDGLSQQLGTLMHAFGA